MGRRSYPKPLGSALRHTLLFLFILGAAAAQAQYSLLNLQTRPGLVFDNINAVSNHGKFMIASAHDKAGIEHYLLYGPDFTQEPQDLNLGAGPTPFSATPWNGGFLAVNDKGHALAFQTADGTAANLFYYTHETHQLTPISAPNSFTFVVATGYSMSASNVVAGTMVANYANGTWGTERAFRWSPTSGMKEILPPQPGFSIVSSAINDLDFQVGYMGEFGFEYREGAPVQFTFDYFGEPELLELLGINDFGYIGGFGVEPFTFFEGIAAPLVIQPSFGTLVPLGVDKSGDSAEVQSLDNFGRAFGFYQPINSNGTYTESYAVLWQITNPSQLPVTVQSLVPSGADLNATKWAFTNMDLQGVIYGYFTDANGINYPVTLTP